MAAWHVLVLSVCSYPLPHALCLSAYLPVIWDRHTSLSSSNHRTNGHSTPDRCAGHGLSMCHSSSSYCQFTCLSAYLYCWSVCLPANFCLTSVLPDSRIACQPHQSVKPASQLTSLGFPLLHLPLDSPPPQLIHQPATISPSLPALHKRHPTCLLYLHLGSA